jgi:hypothetical protein
LDLNEYIREARTQYLDRLRVVMRQCRAEHPDAFPEVLAVSPEKVELKLPEVFQHSRLDVAWREEGKPKGMQIRVDQPVDPESREFHVLGGGVIKLRHFRWDQSTFSFFRSSPPLAEMEKWLTRWFDLKETFPADEDGLHGVVHQMSYPISRGTRHYFTLDLGSAPVEAMRELLAVLIESGATRLHVVSANDAAAGTA